METMKKTLATLLSVLMIICMMPGMTFAGEDNATNGDLADATINVRTNNQTFTGSVIDPEIEVKIGNKLVSPNDYTIKYVKEGNVDNLEIEPQDLINAGNYIVKITAVENETNGIYGSQVTKESLVTIKAKSLTSAMVTLNQHEAKFYYNKRVQTPDVEVRDGNQFIEAVNYETVLPESKEAGEYTAIVRGKNNYTGVIQKNYRIEPNFIVDTTNITCQYTGSAQQPYPNVYKFDEDIKTATPLDRQMFKYTWKNNVNAGNPVSAAKPTVEVTYVGTSDQYNGTVVTYFTIEPCSLSYYDLDITIPNQTTSNTVINEEIKYKGKLLKRYADYTLSVKDNVAYITLIGNYKNFNNKPITKSFTTGKNEINGENTLVSFQKYEYNYTGAAVTPVPTNVTWKDIYGKSITLIKDVDYEVRYENNVNAGIGKAIISGKGVYSGTLTIDFTILGKDNKVTTKYTRYTKYLSSKAFVLSAKSPGDGNGFKYTSDTPSVAIVSAKGIVSIVGTGVAKIKVETIGTSAFNPAHKYVYITVKPQTPKVTTTALSKGKIRVKIKKVNGTTKYQVKYGYSGKYKNKYLKHVNNSYLTTSTTIAGLKKGKNYYVKVRAYKITSDGVKVYGNWTTKKIKVI
ncbi:MAG: fibronectin type III domain-containing protein [Emergencia timonensis]|uniref:fibronectin type III domain-containing protein n=2 Tax=Emergencia timonensis TaxID=1776384 RepID=UPI000A9B7C96|nr:fibronectin type III domain-containing protein [Emergencia timonensis]WNX87344.1 fibronectin type III domain-containing protein [Emergencia timonensis]